MYVFTCERRKYTHTHPKMSSAEQKKMNALPVGARLEFELSLVRPWLIYQGKDKVRMKWMHFEHPLKKHDGVAPSIPIVAYAAIPESAGMDWKATILQLGNSSILPAQAYEVDKKKRVAKFRFDLPAMNNMQTFEIAQAVKNMEEGKALCVACSAKTDKVCPTCKLTSYCDAKCAKIDSSKHGPVCRFIKRKSKPR